VAQRFIAAITGCFSALALQFAEKLAFGRRSAFSAAINHFFSSRALAPEAFRPSFSANCQAVPFKPNKNAGFSA
jgi:hypothetical protein